MITIWKFPIVHPRDKQLVPMPRGAKVLSVHTQNEVITLWAMVDSNAPAVEDRTVYVYGTGNPIRELPTEVAFVGTTMLAHGQLVFHVFVV